MRTLFGRLAAYTFIAALVSAATIAIAAEGEKQPAREPAKETVDKPHRDGHLGEQQNKMKACNVEASKKELKGDERRAFMSACLKGHH